MLYIRGMISLNLDPFPVLETERLSLRQMTEADAPTVHFLRSDDVVMRYIDRPRAQSLEDAKAWMDKVEDLRLNGEGVVWGIYLKGEPRMVGNILLWSFKPEAARAEVGYVMHPDFQRRGIIGEAMDCILDYAFDTIGLNGLEADIQPGNEASIRLAEKKGFRKEAHFREYYFFNGEFKDLAIYCLLKGDRGQ